MADHLRTNDGRLVERFLRSIEDHGYGGMANYHAAMTSATSLADGVELAYGLLWLVSGAAEVPGCGRGWDALMVTHARQVLLERLDRAGQARGIEQARQLMGDDP